MMRTSNGEEVSRFHHLILAVGFSLAAILLVKFTLDFYRFKILLFLSLSLLIAASLTICGLNIFLQPPGDIAVSRPAKILLLSAIPIGFLTSSLDCMGLAISGCTSYCTFIKLVWIPLIGAMCLIYYRTGRKKYLTVLAVMGLVPLIPNCICYNPANGWWIDQLGKSPQCYLWGCVCTLISVSTLGQGSRLRYSFLVCYTIIGGALCFFIAHHYFHYPW
jgi:hypothetical protein